MSKTKKKQNKKNINNTNEGGKEGETKEEYRSRFEKACEKCHILHGAEIENLSFCAQNADIDIKFKNGYLLRSFTTWHEEESWFYTNRKNKTRYYVSANKIEIKNLA